MRQARKFAGRDYICWNESLRSADDDDNVAVRGRQDVESLPAPKNGTRIYWKVAWLFRGRWIRIGVRVWRRQRNIGTKSLLLGWYGTAFSTSTVIAERHAEHVYQGDIGAGCSAGDVLISLISTLQTARHGRLTARLRVDAIDAVGGKLTLVVSAAEARVRA